MCGGPHFLSIRNTAATSCTLQLGGKGLCAHVQALPKGELRRSSRQQLNAKARARGAFLYEYPTQYRSNLVVPANAAARRTETGNAVVFNLHGCRVEVLSLSPFVLEIEKFLTRDMVDELLACVDIGRWSRSQTINENGHAERDDPNRTSSSKSVDAILNPGVLSSIKHRVAHLTGFSFSAIEHPVTLVGYDKGQFYNWHHDAGTPMYSDGNPCNVLDSSTNVTDLVVAIPDSP